MMEKFGNERDVEIPLLLHFVIEHKPGTLLDVGAHWSHASYAPELRKLVETYHAVDFLKDEATAAIVDKYVKGNVLKLDSRRKYDCVISLSALEHAGITTYQVEDYKAERDLVFGKCLALARWFVWFSFPVGPDHLIEGQYGTIDDKALTRWEKTLDKKGFTVVRLRFFVYDFEDDVYNECDREEAMAAEYPPVAKCPAVCVLEAEVAQNKPQAKKK